MKLTHVEHGLKKLTKENWTEPDLVYHGMYDGQVRPMDGGDWASLFLDPSLSGSAPTEVQRLYNVARGCLLYGY